MKKIDPTVKKETLYIALFTVLFSALMELVFVLIGMWDNSVIFGNLLGAFTAVLNFFLMGLTVQKAVNLSEEAAAKKIKLSQMLRLFMIAAIAILGGILHDVFNIFAVIIPLLFPRIAIAFRPLFDKKKKD